VENIEESGIFCTLVGQLVGQSLQFLRSVPVLSYEGDIFIHFFSGSVEERIDSCPLVAALIEFCSWCCSLFCYSSCIGQFADNRIGYIGGPNEREREVLQGRHIAATYIWLWRLVGAERRENKRAPK
jgi:hypothetical protein